MTAGLGTALRALVDSLSVNQQSLGYLSDNIANVNTEGYTRKILSQESNVSNGVVLGVGLAEIRRSIDDFLAASNRDQMSVVSDAETINEYLSRIQDFSFGNPESPSTITNTINEFYTRLDDFANDPSSPVKKSLAVTAAENFTNSISSISNGVYEEIYNADTELENTINQLNTILSDLSNLNAAIRENSIVEGEVERLLDVRDVELEKVKKIINADINFNEFGQVSINVSSAELLGVTTQYELSYSRLSSVDDFKNGQPTGAITVTALSPDGDLTDNVETIQSASNADTEISDIPEGKLRALIYLRDTELPTIIEQLDNFTYSFANEFNEIHNNGSSFPPPTSLTGATEVSLNDEFQFSGGFRLSLLDSNGQPLLDRYGNDLLPLVMDFDEFDGIGSGRGTATVESIINEINNYYGTQSSTSVDLGPAENLKLGAVSSSISSTKSTGTITFSGMPTVGESLDINGSTFTFVANGDVPGDDEIELGISVSGTIVNIAQALNSSTDNSVAEATYTATSSTVLTIEYDQGGTTGDSFTLDASGTANATESAGTLAGGANVSGDFEVDVEFTNAHSSGEDVTIDITSYTISHAAYTSAVITPTFSANAVTAGSRQRSDLSGVTNGSLTLDLDDAGLAGLEEGETFTVDAVVAVTDETGNTYNETVTFTVTVPDPDENIKNERYAATAVSGSGDGDFTSGANISSFLNASLVDADGNSISSNNTDGFLKLTTSDSDITISIDQLDSSHGGDADDSTGDTATNRGFSHFFGLNNFFTYGNVQDNSSLNFDIRSDIKASPSLMASGRAQISTQTGTDSVYTYEVGAGNGTTVQELIALQDQNISFAAAGGIQPLNTTINSYITEIYNSAAISASNAENEYDKQELLGNTLQSKFDDISGVNIDEELALTIQIQNSYAASARVISVVRELFDNLEESLL